MKVGAKVGTDLRLDGPPSENELCARSSGFISLP